MKRGFILLLLASAPLFVVAQAEEVSPRPSWKGFITNGFWDNWFLSVGAGGKVYMGANDHQGDLSKRIAPSFDFAVGKWLMPTLGVRFHLNGISAKGFTRDPNNLYISGNTANAKGAYPQKWKQAQAEVDVLLNASNWIGGYRSDRFFEFVPFVGGGLIRGWTKGNHHTMAVTVGLVNKMRLSRAFDLNLEVRGDVFDAKFSQEVGSRRVNGALTSTIGVAYNFNKRTFTRSNTDKLQEEIAALLAIADKLKKEQAALTRENSELQDKLGKEQNKNKAIQDQLNNQSVTPSTIQDQLIFFEIGTTEVSKADKDRLKKWAEIINETADKQFVITGYADNITGSPKRNLELSKQRAENVFKILTKEFGVDANRLKVEGEGGVSAKDLPSLHSQRVTIIAK
ncbi:MAG: OmpA family protein [Odoribacteraceae bacterium]|jgi:outer membrane protein OmpA-like peptidoglycan-associated protein|nr:OmpA family protein [Odoribacteraceae bacterium]